MRTLSPDLAAHLAGGATTLARCWTLRRRDGRLMGFTDHDRDLLVGGVSHEAGAAIEASGLGAEAGFGAGAADAAGVLRSTGVTEADLAAGLYDGARVELRLVDWRNPAASHLVDVFEIGEIKRGPDGFVAELRTLAHRFDEERGRVFTLRCDADLGDARCGAANPPRAVTVVSADGRRAVTVTGLGAIAAGTCSGGKLVFASGANAGYETEVRDHGLAGGLAVLDLWIEAPRPIAAGDVASVTLGCDKSFRTCSQRFGNSVNFRGFPHMPGNDFVLQQVGEGAGQVFDGGSLFR